jgi:hypothetical protein
LKFATKVRIETTPSVGRIRGSFTYQKTLNGPAPSTVAASTRSSGMLRSAA